MNFNISSLSHQLQYIQCIVCAKSEICKNAYKNILCDLLQLDDTMFDIYYDHRGGINKYDIIKEGILI